MVALPAREFVRSVRDYCVVHELIRPGERVIAAVSGGPDSLAMLHSLHQISGPLRLKLHVAHLDHGLRRGARLDSEFVRRQARMLGWPFTLARRDVKRLAARRRISIEEAGRLARLGFFFQLARRVRARLVALGHHRDDQAETVLMRLLRGAAASGLSGIAPRRRLSNPLVRKPGAGGIWLIRPLLMRSREDIEAFLAWRRLHARQDPTNRSREFLRNRIRHELLPYLERRYNPNIRSLLARAALAIQEDEGVLADQARFAFRRLVRARAGRIALSRRLNRLSLPLRRRVLWLACVAAGVKPQRLTQVHLDTLVGLVREGQGNAHLPGARAAGSPGFLSIGKFPARR